MKKLAENILSWCDAPESGAVAQAVNISHHPCLIGNVCLMPDTHEGYGMPIGGVVALKNAVCPNMVGVDIGCGMIAVKTSVAVKPSREVLCQMMSIIRQTVPVGFVHHQTPQDDALFLDRAWQDTNVCRSEFQSARRQIGTLGGGNHFIELQWGDDGRFWLMVHSGSRNLGKKVADHYNQLAEKLCAMWRHEDCVRSELAFLPQGTPEYDDYLREMELCVRFGMANRAHIADAVKSAIRAVVPDAEFDEPVNIIHNYAALEHHYGANVMVHRKGATLARKGTVGIIPGSQGSCSYIVSGLGNEASMCSCSHGAGRRMSRKKAREDLDLGAEIAKMDALGVVHGIRAAADLDEAPSAYKNIDAVMAEQSDLVAPVVRLVPLAVIKG